MVSYVTEVANSRRNLIKASSESNEAYVIERSREELVEGLEAVVEELWVVQQKLKLLDDYPERQELLRKSGKDGNFAKRHREKLAKSLSSDYKPFIPSPLHDLLLWLYAGLLRKEANLWKRHGHFSTMLAKAK